MKYKRIMVTSRKGGVGKSTVSANLAFAFARRGLSTMVVDLDLSNRSLDLFLGCEDAVLYDLGDLFARRATVEQTVLTSPKTKNLYFLPGVFDIRHLEADEMPTAERLEEILEEAERAFSLDLILLDTSGSADDSADLAYPLANTALIVTNQTEVSIRAAEATGYQLSRVERKDLWLVINAFRTDPAKGEQHTARSIIDRTRMPIMGIVPYDPQLSLAQEEGKLVFENKKSGNATCAFDNIAARLAGQHVPLFSGLRHIRRNKLLHP